MVFSVSSMSSALEYKNLNITKPVNFDSNLVGLKLIRFDWISMTRDQIETAINEGIPFEIRMADGAKYTVRERYRIAVSRTSVVVFDDKDLAHILPLLTMTGVIYLKKDRK